MPIILPKNNWYGKPTISPHSVEANFMNYRANSQNPPSSNIGNTLIYVYSFRIPYNFPITYFWWSNGGTVNGNISSGVYDENANLIISCGTVAMSGASSVQAAAPTASTILGPGKYYIGFATSSATATFYSTSIGIPGYQAAGYRQANVSAGGGVPAPSTLTFTTPGVASVPFFGISRLQVI